MFEIKISGIDDFMAFVAIIRGEDLEELKKVTKELNKSTNDLIKAEDAQQE